MSILMTLIATQAIAAPNLDHVWATGKAAAACAPTDNSLAEFGSPESQKILPLDHVDTVLRRLEAVPAIDPKDLDAVRTELDRDLAGTFGRWIKVAVSGCSQTRLAGMRALMKAGARDPKIREKIAGRLEAVLKRPLTPTYLSESIDLILLEFGVGRGFWAKNDQLLAAIKDQRAKLKSEVKDFDKYTPMLNQAEIGTKPWTPAMAKKLRSSPDYEKIKTALLHEFDQARVFEAERLKLINQIR